MSATDTEKTLVTFSSRAFNCSEPRPHFINPCCYGDDLAWWFAGRLRSRGFEVIGEPGQEDFGWFLGFRVGDAEHNLVMAYRPGDDEVDEDLRPVDDPALRGSGDWLVSIERSRGLLESLFRKRRVGIKPEAILAVHEALTDTLDITNVTWHRPRQFDQGDEQGSPHPW